MSKTMISLIAGILSSWLVISFFMKDFDVNYLFIVFSGVYLGYWVKKKEASE